MIMKRMKKQNMKNTIIKVINNLKGEKLQSSFNILNDEDKTPDEKDIPLIM